VNRVESAVGAHAVRGWGLEANLADAVNEWKFAESRKKGAENNENGIVPLNVWAENPSALEATIWRADTVRLLPTSEQVELLLRLARATQKLVNVEHARRRALYEQSGIIDCSVKGAYHDPSYAGFKEVLGSKNFDEALCLVAESWRSFRELKEMEEQGRLPAWMKPKPPKQLKRLLVAVKYDNYRVDARAKPIAPQAGRGNGVARAQSPPASALLLNRSSTSSRAPASANARSSPLPFSVLSHDALASTGFGGTFTKTILLPTGSTRSMSPGDTKPLGSFTLPRSSALTRYAIKRRKTSLIPKI